MVLDKKLIIYVFIFFVFFSNITQSSQIFDYETEKFIDKLLYKIKEVNNYKKDIKVQILKDTNPNAFVVSKNKIIISSGLLEKSPDYVSLLAVLAHEVGHLQYFHLEKRKDSIEKFSKLNLLSNLALITGSVLADEPEILGGTIASQSNINNFYLSFTKEQEREADLYSVKTLEKLKLPNDSVKKLLLILEKNALSKGYDEEYQKFSTHPIFKERYAILEDNKENEIFYFDKNIENEFFFIKAKFLAYNKNLNIDMLKGDHKIYYDSIAYSISGNLEISLKKINFLINKFPDNVFILETKGDILRSHGYLRESIKFYQKVLNKYPHNNDIKYKIFIDTRLQNLAIEEKTNFFYNYLDLIIHFPKNKYIINKFIKITKDINKKYWFDFFNILNQSNNYKNYKLKEELFKLSEKTNDKNLKEIIYKYLKI